jgi:hypothetical protein
MKDAYIAIDNNCIIIDYNYSLIELLLTDKNISISKNINAVVFFNALTPLISEGPGKEMILQAGNSLKNLPAESEIMLNYPEPKTFKISIQPVLFNKNE